MIQEGEIHADYFKSTKTLAFDQRSNIDEIDNLMKKFEQWESKYCKKCGNKIKEGNQKICEYCGLELNI